MKIRIIVQGWQELFAVWQSKNNSVQAKFKQKCFSNFQNNKIQEE